MPFSLHCLRRSPLKVESVQFSLGQIFLHSVASHLHTDAIAVQAFFESGIINVAGCTISTFNSSQQWDFPSSWPPTEWMMITALQNYGGEPPCPCRESHVH